MTADALSKNTLMHSLQCVHAMARMMEAYIAGSAATNQERGAFGQLLMDFDSVVDNLSAVYEEKCKGDERYPPAEELGDAFGEFELVRKT